MAMKDFISECYAMEAIRHPNIVMFLGACIKAPRYAIVLECCDGGTLWGLLQNHKIPLEWTERIRLALEIAKAMNYLHDREKPIVHRDLKSLNILLDSNRRVKLADFGWTKGLQNYMTSKIGTYQWMAP
jgi:serine/threonine protein kinase